MYVNNNRKKKIVSRLVQTRESDQHIYTRCEQPPSEITHTHTQQGEEGQVKDNRRTTRPLTCAVLRHSGWSLDLPHRGSTNLREPGISLPETQKRMRWPLWPSSKRARIQPPERIRSPQWKELPMQSLVSPSCAEVISWQGQPEIRLGLGRWRTYKR